MEANTNGFTLIELLIVVVIIGILAAIAIPKFANTKQNAYLATVKTDLRNLATAEEGYASNNDGTYFSGTASNSLAGVAVSDSGYAPSQGVTVTITTSGAGWSATAVHSLVTSYPGGQGHCSIFANQAAVAPATSENVPAC